LVILVGISAETFYQSKEEDIPFIMRIPYKTVAYFEMHNFKFHSEYSSILTFLWSQFCFNFVFEPF